MTGRYPPEVADVLARRAAGAAGIREVVMCLTAHRLLVPLLEVDGDLLEGDDADPCAGSDRAVAAVSMREPDGRPLGLAFTGMAPLVAWDAAARPLPVEATRAAGAIVAEGGRALLVDAGSAARPAHRGPRAGPAGLGGAVARPMGGPGRAGGRDRRAGPGPGQW